MQITTQQMTALNAALAEVNSSNQDLHAAIQAILNGQQPTGVSAALAAQAHDIVNASGVLTGGGARAQLQGAAADAATATGNLTTAPGAVEPTFVHGWVDQLDATTASGWASPAGVIIHILQDGVEIGQTRSNIPRPDVANAGYDLNSGFQFTLNVDTTTAHTLQCVVQGQNLPGASPAQVGSTGGGGGGNNTGYTTDPAVTHGPVFPGLAGTVANDSDLASVPGVLFYGDMVDQATITNGFIGATKFYGTSASIDQPLQFFTDPVTGVRYLQTPIQKPLNADDNGNGGTAASWWHNVGPMGLTEIWCRYCFYIDPDVQPVFDTNGVQISGMAESGVKLPGPAGEWEQDGEFNQSGAASSGGGWSYRMEMRRPVDLGIYPLTFYRYDQQANVLNGEIFGNLDPISNVAFRHAQYYSVEVRVKVNGFVDGTDPKRAALANGEVDVWIDGALCFSERGRIIAGDERAKVQMAPFINIFHGGHIPPVGRINFRVGGIVAATQYIGPPKKLAVVTPPSNFFSGLTRYQWTPFPNSRLTVQGPALNRADYVEPSVGSFTEAGNKGPASIFAVGINDWSGAGFDYLRGKFWIRFGGHNSTAWNGMLIFDSEAAAAGDATGGWRIPMQPNLFSNADVADWMNRMVAAGLESGQAEYGWLLPQVNDGLWKADSLRPAQPTSLHSYSCIEYSETLGGLLQQDPTRPINPGSYFWLFKEDGSFQPIAGNAARSRPGIMIVDPVNDVMLGFNIWPNGASVGVRRFNLKTKQDLPPIDLTNQIMSVASNYTQPLYYTETPWDLQGTGFLAGRWFHYRSNSTGKTWKVNIDTWQARETIWNNLSAGPFTGHGAYSPVTDTVYWIGADNNLWQMTLSDMQGSIVATTGTPPTWVVGGHAASEDGYYGRLRYYGARGVIEFINSADDPVWCMKVDP